MYVQYRGTGKGGREGGRRRGDGGKEDIRRRGVMVLRGRRITEH